MNVGKLEWLTKAKAMVAYALLNVKGVPSTAKHWEGAKMEEMYYLRKRAIGASLFPSLGECSLVEGDGLAVVTLLRDKIYMKQMNITETQMRLQIHIVFLRERKGHGVIFRRLGSFYRDDNLGVHRRGVSVLSKAAMSRGLSPFVYVVYYHILDTLLLLPSFILDYRIKHPSLTFLILCRCFLLGLIGYTNIVTWTFSLYNCGSS
ncbi:hypothetical protein GIB67_013110 [Kingdonia uniflora]|uniref:Uncharacterized protein n=1 Tax=Kingdonia uniflora TaxID=39325 RepID=A0A7J7NP73_9MAGN|nr:hypothetical protein GIB67_013110 [Kingdonia uniflora]